ncbi:MAG: type III pantothenate kinase [Candidatus Firestonebacteria bacterium]
MSHKTAVVIIGNSAVKFFLLRGSVPVFVKQVPAKASRIEKHPFLRQAGLETVIIASVVPSLTRLVKKTVSAKIIELKNSEIPIKNLYRNKKETGIDRLLAACAAKQKYGAPLIVLDFGTATTFNVVDRQGRFAGGMILPGLAVFGEYLHARTAKLPKLAFKKPVEIIGRDTEQNILSGTYYGAATMIEGVISLLKKKIKGRTKVVATGGFSSVFAGKIKGIDRIESGLVASGALIAARRRIKRL